MTQLKGFTVYRTENVQIYGKSYTVRFSVSNDDKEYILFVSNNETCQEAKYNFSKEKAEDVTRCHGKDLETEVLEIIKGDIKSGLI